ncbi:CMP-2-keto-3-deoxyoctulosonic acid synthetase [Gordonibacter sp. An230]|nr:CMP-2-keto-3-deoxyoctulosonic acid synthetase [Gordonibacter sp. An230]
MVAKRPVKWNTSLAAKALAVGCASCLVVGCIGIGIASAGVAADSDVDSFGIDMTRIENDEAASDPEPSEEASREANVLASASVRDISQGIAAIEEEEEAARIAAEEAARAEEEARIAAAEAAKARQQAQAAREAAADALAGLPDVDWSVGEEEFVSAWTARIDAYLAGSPLAGQGKTFAEAAWNNGVDPRWSPAISNTESSKGAHCFAPYNAWGWGGSGWSSWEEAINAHVAGLASSYGYSITYASATKYCPPNADHWFSATLSQMKLI